MLRASLDGIDPAPLALIKVRGRKKLADGKDSGQGGADLGCERGRRRLDHAGRAPRRAAPGGPPAPRPAPNAPFPRPPWMPSLRLVRPRVRARAAVCAPV